MSSQSSDGDEPAIDWSLGTWEGARREQLRRWAELPFERQIMAAEEMDEIANNLLDRPTGASATREPSELTGCRPEPLMAYLKALGILRLVGEQKDPNARGWWRGDRFLVRSFLDQDAMVKFFLDEYCPSPLISPWNGDGGFLSDSGTSLDLVAYFRAATDRRFEKIKEAIVAADCVPVMAEFKAKRQRAKALETKKKRSAISSAESDELRATKARVKEIKRIAISRLRSGSSDQSLQWLDACLALGVEGIAASPLLGSGGVDGRLDFGTNFLANVRQVFSDSSRAESRIRNALFGDPVGLDEASIGQFSPGQVGAPNSTQGFEGVSLINPFDYVLMMEGALMFSGAAVRRLGAGKSRLAAFPFTVNPLAAGYGSQAPDEARESRGEIWLPLWERPTASAELRQCLSEGRAELSGRNARDGAEFARAVAGLGVDRGIATFTRISFLKRSGRAFLAAPLGRFAVVERAAADVFREADPWLDRFRRAASDKNAPPGFRSALRRIDSSVIEYCKYGGARLFQEIVVALGMAERAIVASERFTREKKLLPIAGLSSDWAAAADDGSAEFALASGLAWINDPERLVGPVRANLEAVDWERRCRKWAEKDRSVVWGASGLSANMLRVLDRRVMEAGQKGCNNLPLASPAAVPLDAVASFISGSLDDKRTTDLLWGLALVEPRKNPTGSRRGNQNDVLPRAYALLKLLFLPRPLLPESTANGECSVRPLRAGEQGGISVRPEPSVLSMLRGGRIEEACSLAGRRLRASGLTVMPYSGIGSAGLDAARLAATLLIPVSEQAVTQLARLVLRGVDIDESSTAELVGTNQ